MEAPAANPRANPGKSSVAANGAGRDYKTWMVNTNCDFEGLVRLKWEPKFNPRMKLPKNEIGEEL